jgi:hypothetical protein
MFEARPMLLLPLLYLLVVNVCRTRMDYRRMFWAACVGIVVQALLSLDYLFKLPAEDRSSLERLTSHGSAIGMNLVILLAIFAVAYVGVSGRLRLALAISAVPVTWVWIVGQRRAGVIALVIGFGLFAVMLFWRQRRTFWKLIPIVTVVVVGYTGTFWNSQSTAGFPAQAIKSVIAPEDSSERNQSSDFYRTIEDLNLNETIRSSPLLGIGFGQPFLRPYPLADISVFEFNAYIPHNSFLYVWTKLGFAGFVTLLYLIARTMMQGAARARAAPNGPDAVVALGAVVFVAMFALFLYVDIAWESRNMVLFALSMGMCTGHLHDEARPRNAESAAEPEPVAT